MRTIRLWLIQIATILSLIVWAMLDLQFESLVRSMRSIIVDPGTTVQSTTQLVGSMRPVFLLVIVSVGFLSLAMLTVNIFRSTKGLQSRSIASLLAITTTIAVWCGLAINYPSLAWQGKRLRVAIQVQQLEHFVQPLRDEWPRVDGELPEIGPFMAYPFGRPITLILLEPPALSGTGLCVSAIERGADGSIRLQLSSIGHDDWAQWHPVGSRPKSFVGGLGNTYDLQSTTPLARGWYLVRYNSRSIDA
ncbi:MAG: hypothetical protein R3C05_11695 [Pirellulaceae bacterium]